MQIQGGEGTQSPRALALWARAEPDWPAPLRLDESLSPPRSQCGLHLPSLWDQPVDVYRWWRRYDPITSTPWRTARTVRISVVSPPGRQPTGSRPGAAARVSPLGEGQTGRAAAPQKPPAFHFHGGPDPERSEASRRAGGNSCQGTHPSPPDAQPSLGPAQAPFFGPFDSRAIWCNSTPKRCDRRVEWC